MERNEAAGRDPASTRDPSRTRDPAGPWKWVVFMLVLLAVAAVTWLAFDHFLSLNRARIALYSAKTACLAASAVSMEYEAMGKPFGDLSRESGLTEDAEQDVIALGELKGKLTVLQTRKNGYGFDALTYEQEDCVVEYTRRDGREQWQVYKKTALITV